MEMKTLTVNGQTFKVVDPNALHREDILGMVATDPQEFTPEQQAQARANIGALSGTATIEDGVLVVGAATIEDNILAMK